MKINGEHIIKKIVERLNDKNIRTLDSAIVHELSKLDWRQVNQLLSFGDVTKWHNERIEKQV